MARLAQQRSGVLRGGHGQRVDDAAARQLAEPRGQPAEPGVGGREREHAEPQAVAGQRAAHGAHRCPAGAQLLDDVVDHPCVGGRRRGEHRPAGRQVGQQVADPAVVGPEVVPPVADAVRLVDHQQPGRLGKPRQLLVAEPRVVEPLRADQEQVDLVGRERRGHLGPLVGVRGVHGHGPQPGPASRVDLVAHERQQRRHDQRGAAAAGPHQCGGDEVDRRLAPAGALHDEDPLTRLDERGDRLELAVAEGRDRVAHQPGQQRCSLLGERRGDRRADSGGGGGHRVSPSQPPDTTVAAHRARWLS